jgi:hypothetical protein
MKKYLVSLMALLAITCLVALAADIDGKWTRETQGKNGPQTTTLTLMSKGGTLTGTMDGGRGGPLEIQDGKITGNMVSFKTVRDAGDKGKFETTYTGTVSATELKLTPSAGAGGKGGPPMEQVYTKAK